MAVVAWAFIPESLKYLFDRRPADALERINNILQKLGKDTLNAMPPAADGKGRSSLIGNMLKLLAKEHRVATLTLWTTFFLCFSTLYFLMSWIPKLMEDSGFDRAT